MVIVLDTETANDLECPIVYDIGFAVIDENTADVVETHSYLNADIFLDREFMTSAYYAEKIPNYWADVENGTRLLRKWSTIKRILEQTCRKYGVTDIYAHNAIFDYRSCTGTQRYLTCSKYRYFFPYNVNICDTLRYARDVFKNDEKYTAFCEEHNFLTKKAKPQFTAEVIYRYLTGNPEFTEAHTGLEDVLIEKDIFSHCRKVKPDFDARLWKD